jgi:hypothetical protein
MLVFLGTRTNPAWKGQEGGTTQCIPVAGACGRVGACTMVVRKGRWLGDTSPHITARLAGLAHAGQILASPETVRRLGDKYRTELLSREHLKNIGGTVEVYRVSCQTRDFRSLPRNTLTGGKLQRKSVPQFCAGRFVAWRATSTQLLPRLTHTFK